MQKTRTWRCEALSVWKPCVQLQNKDIAMKIQIYYSSIIDFFARADYLHKTHMFLTTVYKEEWSLNAVTGLAC